MRLQHAEKTAGTLPADTPEREHARAVIVAEVDRLRWRIWNGKAKDAQITLERIRQVMPAFQGDSGGKRDPAQGRRMKSASQKREHVIIVPGGLLATRPHADPG